MDDADGIYFEQKTLPRQQLFGGQWNARRRCKARHNRREIRHVRRRLPARLRDDAMTVGVGGKLDDHLAGHKARR